MFLEEYGVWIAITYRDQPTQRYMLTSWEDIPKHSPHPLTLCSLHITERGRIPTLVGADEYRPQGFAMREAMKLVVHNSPYRNRRVIRLLDEGK